MSEVLLFSLICTLVLARLLYESKRRVAGLEQDLKNAESTAWENLRQAVVSEDTLKRQSIALNWCFKPDERHEIVICIERDPTGENPDRITERCERLLDDRGRCVTEWRYTDIADLILKTDYEYGTSLSVEPKKITYYDKRGNKSVWIDALHNPQGQSIAYIRSRAENDVKDVYLCERNSDGLLLREFERCGATWPHPLEDVPSKFHIEFPSGTPQVTEYEYSEPMSHNSKLAPCLKRITCGSNIQNIEHHNGSPRQIIEADSLRLKKAIHYFPNEDEAIVTVIIQRGVHPVEVHIDLTKDHEKFKTKFLDVTAIQDTRRSN